MGSQGGVPSPEAFRESPIKVLRGLSRVCAMSLPNEAANLGNM